MSVYDVPYSTVKMPVPTVISQNGTFTVAYPAGTTVATFDPSAAHTMFTEGTQALFIAPAGFTVTFGPSNITVTYLGATPIPNRSLVNMSFLQFDTSKTVVVPALNTVTATDTAGVSDIFHVVATVSPLASSSAVFPALYGDLFYQDGAQPITGVVFGNDATAKIYTIGPIVSTNLTTTASFQLDTGLKTATAVAGPATLNKASGKVTSEALATAAAAQYFLTLTNSTIAAGDTVFCSVANGTSNLGIPLITRVEPAAGSVLIGVIAFGAAFNGTVVVSFAVMKA